VDALRRSGSASTLRRLADLLLPAVLLAVYAWHLSRGGLPGRVLHEAADSAGDALQVERALGRGWFVTGHHSDVGVHHPGPFALWVKALVDLLHRVGVGGSTYALAMSVFLGLRLVALALLARAFALVASSRLVGWSAALGVVAVLSREGRLTGLDLQGSTIHYLSPWAVVVLLAGALVLASGRGSPCLLVLGAGVTAHVHTPSFPLGVAGLLLAAVVIARPPSSLALRPRVLAGALWAVFVVPLLVRVVLEPGFPFNYLAAARRRQDIAASAAGRSSLDGLSGVLDLPRPLLVSCVALPLLLALPVWRRSRAASGVLAAASLWAFVVLAVSPPQERVATELVWVAGVVLFAAAVLAAASAALVLAACRRAARTSSPVRLARAGAPVAAFAGALLLVVLAVSLSSVLPSRLSTSGGADGRHVPVMADAIGEWSAGRRFALVFADPNWFSTSSGVLLELGRRGADFCVAAGEVLEERLETFLDPSRLCDRDGPPTPAVMVSWDAARGLADLPPGSSLVAMSPDGSTPRALLEPDDLVCSRMGAGGVCFARMPEGFLELVRTREPDEGAYGMVDALRLSAFTCSPHPFLACAELDRPAR